MPAIPDALRNQVGCNNSSNAKQTDTETGRQTAATPLKAMLRSAMGIELVAPRSAL